MDTGTLKVALAGAGLVLANALLVSTIVNAQAERREQDAREEEERSLTQELDQIQLDLDDLTVESAACEFRVRRLEDRVTELLEAGQSPAF
jgi:phage shock protein A